MKNNGLIFVVILFLLQGKTAEASYPPLTAVQYNSAYAALVADYRTNTPDQSLALRLAFHCCVGGCDGCLNLAQSDNAGLSTIVNNLEPIYGNYSSVMSRADFWAIAGLAAVGQGINAANRGCAPKTPNCNVPALPATFLSGRVDCPTSPNTANVYTFPSGAMGNSAMFSFFQSEFGFNATQVTALMGAHTTGFALPANSGYAGTWKPNGVNAFNNGYYQQMLNPQMNWQNVNLAPPSAPKWQYFGNGTTPGPTTAMMLNTDFELAYQVTLNPTTGQATCNVQQAPPGGPPAPNGLPNCAQAPTYNLAASYSNNVNQWINDFSSVFSLMIQNKAPNLIPLQ